MNAEQLRALQAPLKAKYRDEPSSARVTLRSEGKLGAEVTCNVATGRKLVLNQANPPPSSTWRGG